MSSQIKFIVDSSAVLALLLSEPGSELVGAILYESGISAVNYSEVITILVRRGASPAKAQDLIGNLELDTLPFDEDVAVAAADLSRLAWSRGLSLGDRACLAHARQLGVPAVTADAAWQDLDTGIAVKVIR